MGVVQQISSRMAASVVALLSSLLPVVSGMVVDPSYMRYIQQSGSFLEQDPGAMLSGAINDVSDRQKQMQGANAKQLQDEASKQAKIQQDFDKVAADMKQHMDHLAQKLQEKKAQDSEAKVQPARDDAMKQAQMAADKQLQDEMAKAKAASDDWNKKLNDENAKEQKLLADNEKKSQVDADSHKKQADDQIAKASKVTADTEAQANKVATDMGNKLQQFEKKAADDSQKASAAMQKEQADIEKKANDEKTQMKNEA